MQLAAATALGLLTVTLVIVVLALGLFQEHARGPAWFMISNLEVRHASSIVP
jgi:hypothetical protein